MQMKQINMHNYEIAAQLNAHIQEIAERNNIVIVEGIKDKRALEELGITNILVLNKRPLYAVVERVAVITDKTKELTGEKISAVILTDLDKTGKKLYGRLNSDLQSFGVRVDNKFREFLFNQTKLRQIEGMKTYAERLKETE